MSSPTQEQIEQAARFDMTVEQYSESRERCWESCHPQTCNHPWAK